MGNFTSWTKLPSAVFTATQGWENGNIEDGCIYYENGTYYRFYCAGTSFIQIGYATTTPALFPSGWVKYASNPIISPNVCYPPSSGVAIAAPKVIKMQDGSYRMYVHAYNGTYDRGFLFTATAGGFPNTWSIANSGNPIFSESGSGFDSTQIQTQVIIPSWISNDGSWHLFYVGFDGTTYSGGHAKSTDGITWTNRSQVASPSGSGWYSTHIFPIGWFKIGDTFYLTADGFGSPTCTNCIPGDGSNPTGKLWRVGYFQTDDLNNIGSPSANAIISADCDSTWDQCGCEGFEPYQSPNGTLYGLYLGIGSAYNPSGGSSYSGGISKNTTFVRGGSNFGTTNKISNLGTGDKVNNLQ